jgi:putative DNA primase/helicase
VTIHNIPTELQSLIQFVVWKLKERKGNLTKVPYNARTKRGADSTNPSTWATFNEALSVYSKGKYDGIGFVFANGYCGIDLDHCRNAETGEIEAWAIDIVKLIDSYTEISPSGTGLHIITKAKLDGDGVNRCVDGHKIEIYDCKRYFTITGDHLEGTPENINDKQSEVSALYDWVIEKTESKKSKPQASKPSYATPLTLDDKELLDRARSAANGAKFQRLWSGDSSEYEDDVSDADQGFVSQLCFWTQDDAQVERLWKSSQRYRGKLERDDYITRTIKRARSYQTASYTGEFQSSDEQDITDMEEITGDDFPIVDDPEREKLLRLFACNAAKVMEAYVTLLKLLGFKKNHTRLLIALTAVGRARLGTFVAAQSWLKERYQEHGEHSSEETVRRDIRKLLEEQAELGIRLISYTPGSMDSKGYRFASQFKNHLLRYGLQAISISLDIRKSHKHTSAALEAACREVIASIPQEEPSTFKGQAKRQRVKTKSDLETRLNKSENELIEWMIAQGWAQSEIDAEFEELERERRRRVSEAFKIRIKPTSKSAELEKIKGTGVAN